MHVFGADGFLADQLGGHVFVFGGDFLANLSPRLLATPANLFVRFQDDTLNFQLHRRQGMPAEASFPFAFSFVFGSQVWFQHLLAERGRLLGLFL